ncbi:MAG TPA: TolC family protein [Opitutaceae bacterium]|nr:TolC family protein [Opitutaceae bacterium]
MKVRLLRPSLVLLGASLLAAPTVLAQEKAPPFARDGQPDPSFDVPPELNLQYALAFALDNNFAIRQAKERIRQQEGVVLEVKSARIPNVSSTAGYERNAEEISTNGLDHSWAVNITATQVLFSGGGVSAGIKSQELAREAAILAMKAVVNDVLLAVRTQFYEVLVSRERIKVQEQSVELLQRQLQDVRNRFEAGTVSNFEVLRAEVALANAQPPLISARNAYRLAIDDLRQLLGFVTVNEANVSRLPEFLGTLEFAPVKADLGSSLLAAREQRPELQRLRLLEASAEETVKARRAGYFPTVSLFGAYDWRRAPASSTSSMRDGWSAGVQAQWDIFDGRATAGRVIQARSLLEQTRLATADFQLSIDVEVRRAVSSLQEATELAEASAKVVEQAEEALRLANARFSAGTATQLDVLTAQTDLTTARLNQLEANYRFNVAVAALRRATGQSDELFGAL